MTKPKLGRPCKFNEHRILTAVNITEEERDVLRKLGNGNITAGLSLLIIKYKDGLSTKRNVKYIY